MLSESCLDALMVLIHEKDVKAYIFNGHISFEIFCDLALEKKRVNDEKVANTLIGMGPLDTLV